MQTTTPVNRITSSEELRTALKQNAGNDVIALGTMESTRLAINTRIRSPGMLLNSVLEGGQGLEYVVRARPVTDQFVLADPSVAKYNRISRTS